MSPDDDRRSKRRKNVKTLQEKAEILDMLDRSASVAAVARRYNMNESTVRSIKKKRTEIRNAVAVATPTGATTLRQLRDPLVSRAESAVFLWMRDCHKKGIPVDSNTIKEKAKSLYTSIGERIGERNPHPSTFHASNGWFHNFRKRFNLRYIKNAQNIDSIVDFPTTFQTLIQSNNYAPQQVFNAYETALFWKNMLQRRSKAPRDRLTMLLCVNAAGFMIKPSIVYKNSNPKALKRRDKSQLPVYWMNNKKAFNGETLFLDWFKKCFLPEIIEYLARERLPLRALLLLDNAPGRPDMSDFKTDFIEVLYMPPDTTSAIQPMDQGVVRAFKAHYTRLSLEKILRSVESDPSIENITESWKNYTIADAIGIVNQAVDAITPEMINSCWTNLWPRCVESDIKICTESVKKVMEDVLNLAKMLDVESFDNREIEELIDGRSGALTEDDLMELTFPEGEVISDEDQRDTRVKFTMGNIEEGLCLFKSAIDHFADIDPLPERFMKMKESVEGALLVYNDALDEMKKRQSDISTYLNNKNSPMCVSSLSTADNETTCPSSFTVDIKNEVHELNDPLLMS